MIIKEKESESSASWNVNLFLLMLDSSNGMHIVVNGGDIHFRFSSISALLYRDDNNTRRPSLEFNPQLNCCSRPFCCCFLFDALPHICSAGYSSLPKAP